MTDIISREKDKGGYSLRRKRSLHRKRLMDVDKGTNPDQLPPGTLVAIYSRVSSEDQVHGYSLEAQVHACQAFAAQRKWKIVEYYSDPGQSGKDDQRPAFSRMIADARTGQFKAILFHKLDRFSRNIENTLRYFRDLNACDVLIASVTEDFDFTTAQGRLVFRMMALFAQWYLENLSAEVVKSKMAMARHGIQNGPVPFGYIKDRNKNQIMIVEEEAKLIQTVYQLYATGKHTDQTIADFMNQSGSLTRKGNRWTKDTVTDILQNEFFYGMVAYRDQLWPGRHPAIIARELFDRVKEMRTKHAHRPRSHIGLNKVVHANLLRGIVCCNHCQQPLRIQSTRHYGYYLETSRYRGRDCIHSNGRVRMDYLDQMVFGLLRNVRLPEDWQLEIKQLMQNLDVVRQVEKRKLEIGEELRRAARAFADGAFSEKSYERRRRKLISEKDLLVVPDDVNALDLDTPLDDLSDFLEEANNDEKKRILHLLFETIYYDFDQKRVAGFKPQAEFVHIFHPAATLSGWIENEGLFSMPLDEVSTNVYCNNISQ